MNNKNSLMNAFYVQKVLFKPGSRVEVAVESNAPVDDDKADSDAGVDHMGKMNCSVQFLLRNKFGSPKIRIFVV